jgi:hypothetical protein
MYYDIRRVYDYDFSEFLCFNATTLIEPCKSVITSIAITESFVF